MIFAEDPQTEELHQICHKTDIADRIVRIISIKTNTQDQTQVEVITQIISEIVPSQALETGTIP